jgi:membrane protein implicated in regulation of membrane protease activity
LSDIVSVAAQIGPQHWLVLGLLLLIAELATGTTYLLWPAVAAFVTAAIAWLAPSGWMVEFGVFAALVIALTWAGRPLVQRWRNEGGATGLNERASTLIGVRGVVTLFENGAGSAKVGDTVWRVVSDEALAPGEAVVIAAVDGVTLKVKRAG